MTRSNSTNKKSFAHSALLYFWSSFVSPLSLVTFFGPLVVLKLSFLFLKEKLSRPEYTSTFPDLKLMVQNPWTEPMADYNVQFIVLIIVFVFAVYEILSRFFGLIQEHTLNEVKNRIQQDTWAMLFVTMTAGFLIVGFTMLILGSFSTPENIELFKSNAEYYAGIGWGVHPPPLMSNIFWARVAIIVIYSPVSNYLLNKKLPIIFDKEI